MGITLWIDKAGNKIIPVSDVLQGYSYFYPRTIKKQQQQILPLKQQLLRLFSEMTWSLTKNSLNQAFESPFNCNFYRMQQLLNEPIRHDQNYDAGVQNGFSSLLKPNRLWAPNKRSFLLKNGYRITIATFSAGQKYSVYFLYQDSNFTNKILI